MNDTLQSMIPFIFSGACFTFVQFLIQRHDIKSDKYKELNDKANARKCFLIVSAVLLPIELLFSFILVIFI